LIFTQTSIRGEVVRIDHFGNVLTNIMPLRWLDGGLVELASENGTPIQIDAARSKVSCGWHTINGLHTNYTAVPHGQPIALIGSSQELEIAINQGNASQAFDIKVGSPVTLQFA
jgi:S-adenosylmethionine hydrolase